ncbi:MAG: hypothetical protein NTY66_03175 [Candidatus Vogelbacteria bacterium]|nr:hypothetical protein [Candidatus Vogelbacteria bacterium]
MFAFVLVCIARPFLGGGPTMALFGVGIVGITSGVWSFLMTLVLIEAVFHDVKKISSLLAKRRAKLAGIKTILEIAKKIKETRQRGREMKEEAAAPQSPFIRSEDSDKPVIDLAKIDGVWKSSPNATPPSQRHESETAPI